MPPNEFLFFYLKLHLLFEIIMGLKDKVRETADIVCSKEPKVQSPAVKEMREEVRKLKAKNTAAALIFTTSFPTVPSVF
jgi:hypothetical protein